MSQQRSKILVIQWARLGDLFHSRPLCESALRVFHPATITFSCDEKYSNVVSSFPEVDTILPLNLAGLTAATRTDATLAEALYDIQKIVAQPPCDVVINLTNHKSAQFFAAMQSGSRRFGYGFDGDVNLRQFEESIHTGRASSHIAEMWHSLVEPDSKMNVPVSLSPTGLLAGQTRAVVICDAGSAERSLSASTLETVLDTLRKTGVDSISLVGTRKSSEPQRRFNNCVDLRGKTTLSELRDVIVESSIVVGPDTGALHFAAALGKRVVGVYLAGARRITTGPICTHATCIEGEHQDDAFRERLADLMVNGYLNGQDAPGNAGSVGESELSIVITEHGQTHYADVLISRLREIPEARNAEIIVMSGGLAPLDENFALSREGVIADIADQPRTFSEACNRGAIIARGKWLLFLNDDTDIDRDAFNCLLAARASRKIIGPNLKHWDGLTQSAGYRFDGETVEEHGNGEWSCSARKCDGVSAAAMLVERSVFQSLGGFDERFKNGYEDVDFCLRAAQQGITPKLAACEVTHFGGSSPDRFACDDENLVLLQSRWSSQKGKRTLTHARQSEAVPLLFLSEDSADSAGAVLRWREPLTSIGLRENIDFRWISTRKASIDECLADVDRAETIVVFRALAASPVQSRVIQLAKSKQVRLIYDSDDAILNRFDEMSPRAYRRRPYEDAIRELIYHADVCVGATQGVLKQYDDANRPPLLIETGPSAKQFRERRQRRGESGFNIGYAGGAAHQTDVALALPALRNLLDDDESLRFYWWGVHPGELAFHPQVRRGGGWIDSYDRHLERIQQVPIDLWIVPLADAPHNAARSPLKAFEYIGMNAPCLFSDVQPYRSLLETVSNGLLVQNETSAWKEAILSWRSDGLREEYYKQLSAARQSLVGLSGRFKPYADLLLNSEMQLKRNFSLEELEIQT